MHGCAEGTLHGIKYACVVTECDRLHTAGRKGDGTVTTADAVTLCITAQCSDDSCCKASAGIPGS